MEAYIILEVSDGGNAPTVLNPCYLSKEVAEDKLEELNVPFTAYYEWKNAQRSYVRDSEEYTQHTDTYEAICVIYKQKQSEGNISHWVYNDLNKAMQNALKARELAVIKLEAEFKETNPMPKANWGVTYTLEKVEII